MKNVGKMNLANYFHRGKKQNQTENMNERQFIIKMNEHQFNYNDRLNTNLHT